VLDKSIIRAKINQTVGFLREPVMLTKGEKTKEKIIQAAAELFLRKGFIATSISDLLEATGVTKGSLYFHFSGKDDIALAVLENAEEEFMAFLDAALAGPSPAAKLDNFFRQALDAHCRRGFIGGCLFGNTALEASDSNDLYAQRASTLFTKWIANIRTVVADAQAAGQVRTDLPADILAQFVVSSIEGGIMLARLRKEEEPLRRCLDSLRTLMELKV
jgi:TetR/AcrR family transcriptional regulator, transcriptional repressor for nem operon